MTYRTVRCTHHDPARTRRVWSEPWRKSGE